MRLEQLQQQLNRSKVSVSTVREYLAYGLTNLQTNNPKACKKLFYEYIDKIIISQDEVKIYLRFTCVDSTGVGDGNRTHMV